MNTFTMALAIMLVAALISAFSFFAVKAYLRDPDPCQEGVEFIKSIDPEAGPNVLDAIYQNCKAEQAATR